MVHRVSIKSTARILSKKGIKSVISHLLPKNQRSMRKEYIPSAKTELERLQKQGNTAANSTLPSNEPTTGTRATTRPFPAKKKATPFLPMPPHRKVKGIVRAVPFHAYSIQWGNFVAKSALKYQPPQ